MSSMEFNKMAMALLIAGITAMVAGFIARGTVSPAPLEQNAYVVDLGEDATVVEEVVEEMPSIGVLMAAADAGSGEGLSRACAACHSFDNGGANKIGPNLWDIVNRPIASAAGFNYSSALAEKGGDWTYEALEGFLAAPRDWAPGTSMSYAGMRKPEDRADLIAWLRSLSDNPAELPAAEGTESESRAEAMPAAETETATEMPAETAAEPASEAMAETPVEAVAEAVGSQIATLLAAANVESGKGLSRACAACHSSAEGAANRVGPNLWEVVNRPIGGVDGYGYSSALKEMGGTWTFEALDGFLAAPRDWAPGTKMSFAGVRDAADRADLIVWMRSLSSEPTPLPQ